MCIRDRYRAIGTALKVSETCVENTVTRFKKTGTVTEDLRSGRPHNTSPCQDRKLLIMSRKNCNASASDLLSMMKENDNTVDVSVATVSSRLCEKGMNYYYAIRKPLLNDLAKKRCMETCCLLR